MKITYLFGAGASCKAIPIVRSIKEDLKEFQRVVSEKVREYGNLKQFLEDLNLLISQSGTYDTIDTFAKKLFLTRKQKNHKEPDGLDKLKALLSCYFTWRQAVYEFDKRYDNFIASVAEKKGEVKFPDSMRILTWNYDMQLEIAFSKYVLGEKTENLPYNNDTMLSFKDRFDTVSNSLNSRPFVSIFDEEVEKNRFAHVRLNGIAGSTFNIIRELDIAKIKNPPLMVRKVRNDDEEIFILKSVLNDYLQLMENNFLNFAWEKNYNEISIRAITHAKAFTADTETMVVVGYSFPFFNREIDRDIVQSMTKLRKVYIQDPNAEGVAERFESIRNGLEVICKRDTEQFFLPPEL